MMNKRDTMQTLGWILCDMAHYIEAYDRELQTIERERGMTPKYNNPFAPVLRDWITDGWFDPTDTRFMYERRAGFNPNQPRHPAGSPGSIGGRWRSAGGGNGGTGAPSGGTTDPLFRPISDTRPVSDKPQPFIPGRKNPPVPVYNNGITPVKKEDWERFNKDVQKVPGLSAVEKHAYQKTFAVEGGLKKAPNSSAVAGVLQGTLDRAKQDPALASMLKDIHTPSDLKNQPELVPHIYRNYFDKELERVGGSAALARVGDPYAAAAMADSVFQHGRADGARVLGAAIKRTDPVLGAALPRTEDIEVVGDTLFPVYQELARNPETLGPLLDNIAEEREALVLRKEGKEKLPPGEAGRFDLFRFEKERDLGQKL